MWCSTAWYHDGVKVTDVNATMANGSLVLRSIDLPHEGVYHCQVTNDFGIAIGNTVRLVMASMYILWLNLKLFSFVFDKAINLLI